MPLLIIALFVLGVSAQARQMSRLICSDTASIFDESTRILYAEEENRMRKRTLTKSLHRQMNLKKVYCADGFIREGLNYIFFHTNVNYPVNDETRRWDMILNMTRKVASSNFLRSGWYVHEKRIYYFLEKSVLTAQGDEHLLRFTFFEMDGGFAVVLFECDKAELFEQLPVQVVFAHQGDELKIPIFQY